LQWDKLQKICATKLWSAEATLLQIASMECESHAFAKRLYAVRKLRLRKAPLWSAKAMLSQRAEARLQHSKKELKHSFNSPKKG